MATLVNNWLKSGRKSYLDTHRLPGNDLDPYAIFLFPWNVLVLQFLVLWLDHFVLGLEVDPQLEAMSDVVISWHLTVNDPTPRRHPLCRINIRNACLHTGTHNFAP